jgi:hypothetical protein
VHFERGDWDLFDKESPSPSGEPPSICGRLVNLYSLLTAGFSRFTLNSQGKRDRVMQRFTLARVSEPEIFEALASQYLASGRIRRAWRAVAGVRRAFVRIYPYIQPLLQMRHWHKELQDLRKFKISDKKFDDLRQLYTDCFETLCRLMVLAMAVEAIIHHKELEIPTRKGKMTLDQFEALNNASKVIHIQHYLIGELFAPVLDADFRNSLGHNSAHYEASSDAVFLYGPKHCGPIQRSLGYTEFCDKVHKLFAAFELAAIYHCGLHIYVEGRFA